MKKVIFICLLSFSICMSRPDGAPGSTPPAVPSSSISPLKNLPSQPMVHDNSTVSQGPMTVSTPAATEATVPTVSVVTQANKSTNDTNKSSEKNETAKPDTTTKPEKPIPTPLPDNKGKATIPDQPVKNETTTVKPTPKPTETPKATDTPPLQARGFDGPSFIGGIILTLGLLAIGFMGFKYYKNQTERNYHTL